MSKEDKALAAVALYCCLGRAIAADSQAWPCPHRVRGLHLPHKGDGSMATSEQAREEHFESDRSPLALLVGA